MYVKCHISETEMQKYLIKDALLVKTEYTLTLDESNAFCCQC